MGAILIAQRIASLKKLLQVLQKNEAQVLDALSKDFKKPPFETYVTEYHYVISDLKKTLKNLKHWAKPQRVLGSFINFPSAEYIYREPYGRVLIISPWNYPFQLALCPLVAAIAAGNRVVLKPSEVSYYTGKLLTEIISDVFDPKHAVVIQGDADIAKNLLKERWDYIFFTGSTAVGKYVAEAAAKHLTPTTLELGGKNPCIIDEHSNLKVAARRIVWGKFINTGQTCIAPDYILVQAKEKYDFIQAMKTAIQEAFGENPKESPDFGRIISDPHWKRLTEMIDPKKVLVGGETDFLDRYIAPTLIDEPSAQDDIMKGEIFGPLLPIISYETEKDIAYWIQKYEKPLALYVFTENKAFGEKMIQTYSFGGGCINDTIIQVANPRLPFGGVGHSGMGAYHGKFGFETFSHRKAIVKRPTYLDIPLRYAPYGKKFKWVKRLLPFLD